MNISDVTIDYKQYEGKDRLNIMFEKQDELRVLYEIPILELDLPRDQHTAREFAWNTTEETGEVLDVFLGTRDLEHIRDEIADAFSFYLELFLMCGIGPKDFDLECGNGDKLLRWFRLASDNYKVDDPSNVRYIHSVFIEKLSLAINNLKNRKWRKTNLKTNKRIYRDALLDTFEPFIAFVQVVGLTDGDLFDCYLRKHAVNMFRIKSKY